MALCYSCCLVAQLCPTVCDPINYSTPGFPGLHCSLEFAQTHVIELVLSNLLFLCHPLLLLPSIFPSIKVFSNESALHMRWPKYWSFSFSISPSSEYSELIPFRIDRFYLLAVQGTLKCLLQHHNSKRSLVLSLPYGPTLTSIHDYWKIHSLDYFLPISEIVKSFSLYCLVWGPLATGVTERLKCG